MPLSSRSQIAINSAKAKKLTNGTVDFKQNQSDALVKLIRQNSCCSICRKCISEKKKLVAHKKLCILKLKKKQSCENLDGLSENEDQYFDQELVSDNKSKKEKSKSIKVETSSDVATTTVNVNNTNVKNKSQDSINNIFLFQ
jgi:hypothetical protein